MLFTGYVYEVKAVVSFTLDEIEMLMKLSSSHYDYKCKEAGQRGGFIYGLNNRLMWLVFEWERETGEQTCEPVQPVQEVSVEWSFGECDLTAKVCEIANYSRDEKEIGLAAGVFMGMLKACHKINEESERLNKNSNSQEVTGDK